MQRPANEQMPIQQPLEQAPPPKAVQAAQVVQAPGRMSSTTAWWIAVGVVIVALAVAAGVLVGLNLARRGSPSGAAGAPASAMAEIFLAAHAPSQADVG
ncbi:hypothetical protein AB0J72_05220 [Dactylosporangium sp. NPDC049742]|uniref:hypothetical protein n=1 Tax=Dactylosporangium sp. NPDC049742 TaxID=3154737 RepID=UPI003417DDAE